MKLTKPEIIRIAQDYGLGRVNEFSVITGGAVNYNYDLKTDNGRFVVRVLGRKDRDLDRKLELEFRVTEYLREKRFPYEVPNPIKNSFGDFVSGINGKRLWIYRRIEGQPPRKINDEQLREIARALARYHQLMMDFDYEGEEQTFDLIKLRRRYGQMKRVKPKYKMDSVMLGALPLFEACLERVGGFDFRENVLLTHQDIHRTNVLFQGDRLVGILDFENLTFTSRINDIAYIAKSLMFKDDQVLDKKRIGLFLAEYEKTSRLSEAEKRAILPWLIRYNCIMFNEFYEPVQLGKCSEESCLKWTIDTTKGTMKELGWK